jgi:hypothetical protein
MAAETILQSTVVSKFILPFLLVFFIIFAILEKTKLLGDGQKQLNALTAFVLGLIFVGAVFPKEVVGNLVLFLSVAMVVVFVTLLLWGFAGGGKGELSGNVKKLAAVGVFVAVFIAVLWAVGVKLAQVNTFFNTLVDFLFYQSWSSAFWTNALFIVVIAVALAVVLKSAGSSSSG